MSSPAFTITGTLVYSSLEGGFWGIIAPDGKRYSLVEAPPPGLQQPGLAVQASVLAFSGVSIRMWGRLVHLLQLEALPTGA